MFQDFHKKIYSINHCGGKIDFVKKNLQAIAKAKSDSTIDTNIEIHYFMFDYSTQEYDIFKKFADNIGLPIIPIKGRGNPKTVNGNLKENTPVSWFEKNMRYRDFNASKQYVDERIGLICPFAWSPLIINHLGNCYLCCSRPLIDGTIVGNFLKDNFDEIQFRRYTHHLCGICNNEMAKINYARPTEYIIDTLVSGMKSVLSDIPRCYIRDEDFDILKKLSGKKVYFYGCGGIFTRKHTIFSECIPTYVLSDFLDNKNNTEKVYGITLRKADEVLSKEEILPIIIFARKDNAMIIKNKIEKMYPQFKDIYILQRYKSFVIV